MRTIGIGALMDKNLILLNSLRLLVKFEIAIFCRKKKKRERENEIDLSIAKMEGWKIRNWKIWGKEIESLSKESDISLSPADYAQYRKWGLSRESGFQEWLRGTRTSLPWQRSRHVEQNGVPLFFLPVYTDAQKEKERSSSFIVIHLRNFTLVSITFSSFKITSFVVNQIKLISLYLDEKYKCTWRTKYMY